MAGGLAMVQMAARVLPVLAADGRLRALGAARGSRGGARDARPFRLEDAAGVEVGQVAGEHVASFLGLGWVRRAERRPQEIVITEQGRAWLREQADSGESEAMAPDRGERRTPRSMVVDDDGTGARIRVNAAEHPLAWLIRRKAGDGQRMLNPAQIAAAERFSRDFQIASATPGLTRSLALGTRVSGGGGNGDGPTRMLDAALAARQRLAAARAAAGPELAAVLDEVCCHAQGLEAMEKRFNWPARSAKVVLRIALSALARHYGLEGETTGARRGAVLHSAVEGYRPRL